MCLLSALENRGFNGCFLFGRKVLPLDQFVFNTEAHPLPIAGSAADAAAAKFYVHGPRNDGADSTAAASGSVPNDTLEQRAKVGIWTAVCSYAPASRPRNTSGQSYAVDIP